MSGMILDRFRLDGDVAIVTGAGRGIGRAIATALSEVGADVTVSSRTQSELDDVATEIASRGRRALPLSCDVRKRADIERVVAETLRHFGRVDVLVNNAGIFQVWAQPEDVSEEEWNNVFTTDLKSAFLASQLAGREMVARKKGSIINVASIAGAVALPLTASYTASKAGLIGLTKVLAIDWAPYNVRVNAVAPGFIATPANATLRADVAARSAVEAKTPLGRFGEMEEVATVAVFLASRAASYITGETILVDGGWVAQ
jgi:NAD(P)-dependent dehydrogenase (short-subunit alcohol dehydrogenase family)